jgi:hypothetical protein
MLFDHRTYTVKPGTLPKQLELYAQHGRAPQERHLGPPLLYGITETGPINSYVHVWVYDDAADRARKRAAMQARSRMAGVPEAERRGGLPGRAGEPAADPGPVLQARALSGAVASAGAR